MGDLTTMGLDYPFKGNDISASAEIKELARRTGFGQMRILTKNAPHTGSNGSKSKFAPSNLDHVVAAKHLKFKKLGGAEVDVRGRPQLPTNAKKDAWIAKFSDHGLLYFEVQKV
ncbi:MAG: hypothetical protein O7D91_03610 [Planctomycetota bacterium]|nr:hypothetical protein [Planctomycetota bacterium]